MKTIFTFKQTNIWKWNKLLLSILFFFISTWVFAQLSGNFTIGSGGSYASFTAAAEALHTQGVSGPVVFNVLSGTYKEQFTLDYIPYVSETNSVTFQSQTGNSTDVVIVSGDATYADNYVVKLTQQSYITFRNMTFKTTNETYGRLVVLEVYGDHLTFSHCLFEGVYSNQNVDNNLLYGTGMSLQYIIIENNTFLRAATGVDFNCSETGKYNFSPQVTGNRFDSVGFTAIRLYTANQLVVSGNRINGSNTGISLSNVSGRGVIEKNKMINISKEGMYISNLHSSSGFETEITNNMIEASETGISFNNSSYFNVYNNTVLVNYDYFTTTSLYLSYCTGNTISIENNNLICENNGRAIWIANSGQILKGCDYNNYYSPGRILAKWDGRECEDLRSLKSISGDNAHALFVWPGFESDTVLKPRSAWLDDAGAMVPGVDDDIDGTTRNNPPDIGCYEFTASNDVKPPLSGTITIGSGGYATLQQVLDDARIKGISDSLKILFPAGTYNIHYTIHPVTGASPEHPVIIESASGNAGDVTLQYDAVDQNDNWIMKLRGSSFLQFRNLTFKALDNRYCLLFDMSGMLDSLIFNSCVFTGKPINQSGTDIITVVDNINFHYMEYSNNVFNLGGTALNIYMQEYPSAPGKLIIENNRFNKSEQEAINLSHIGSVTIFNNVIDSAGMGINVRYINNDAELNNNKIITEYGNGIYLSNSSFSSDSPGRIYNNFVSSYGSTNSPGIFISSTDTISLHYNSVYANTQIDFSPTNNYCPLRVDRGKAVTMHNNIFFDNGKQYSVHVENSDIISSDNNCFYTGGTDLAYWDQVCADLDALKTISGMNEHSLFADPLYVSPVDLHVQSALLDSAGAPVAGITEDIDGDLRDPQYPDIGADEFGAPPTNFPPVAVNDTAEVMQGSSVNIPVLDNDSDPDQDMIHVFYVGAPAEGSITSGVKDTLTYLTPQSDFTGFDSVIYYIRDDAGLSDSAWVFVKVMLSQNRPPVAVDDYASVMQGEEVEIRVLENDSDPDGDSIILANVVDPQQGSVQWSQQGIVTYSAPQSGFTGEEVFRYFIMDSAGLYDSARVHVTVEEDPFEPSEIALDPLSMGTALWGDYDMDGDMDILTGGVGAGNVYQVKLYTNEGGSFPSSSLVTQVSPGQFDAVAWGDFDNDGDPDLIVSGYENSGLIRTMRTRLFQAENGQLTEIISGINMSNSGSVDWGDFDNDGDIDLLTGGNNTKVYRNDGAGVAGMWTFTEVKTLPQAREGSAKWGDYDGDGDLDILLTSTLTSGTKLWLYRNDGGEVFTEINTGIENITGRSIWFDYNHDGWPDVVFAGRKNDTLATKIYRNDPDGAGRKFTDIEAGLKGLEAGSLSFCDYDLDGDADLLITGTDDAGKAWTILYNYADNGRFVESGLTLPGVKWGNGAWGDVNGDGKPDLLLLGYRYDPANPGNNGAYTAVFINNISAGNTPPTLPGGLAEEVSGSTVILSWNPSTDEQSYARALTYNLRMGTHTETSEIVSAMANPATGKLYVQQTGNIAYHLQWKINNLQLGRMYYWSVEAVDPAYGVSGFAAERSFKMGNDYFSENPLTVPEGLAMGDVEWGDYDNDGDLDLAMTGKTNDGNRMTVIYRNNGGSFANINAGLQGMWQSALAWGDYDNDGDLDLVVSGNIADEGINGLTKIYRNDGNDTFTDIQATLINVADGDVAWADYDNDGDLDLFITGRYTGDVSVAKMFRNDDGVFTLDTDVSIPGVYNSSVSWYDFDKDEDQDILIAGMDDQGNAQTKIYVNNGGVFTEKAGAGLPGIYDGEVAWMDYNNDGYPDILLAGNTGEEGAFSGIYRNDHNGNFHEINTSFDPAGNSTVAWGDLDFDGTPDVVIGSPAGVDVYLTGGGGALSKAVSLPGLYNGAIALGDYNGDRRLDMVLTGEDSRQTAYCKIYYNVYDGAPANLAPNAPEGLNAYNDGTGLVFEWEEAGDRDTPRAGLSYNLRVGTTPGSAEIMPPMSDLASGYRKIVQTGNAGQNTRWKITGLEEGQTYYWSVQSVDAGFLASPFAEEQSVNRLSSHTVSGDIFLYSQMPATMTTVWALSVDDEGYVSNIVSADLTGTNHYDIHGVPEGRTTVEVFPVPGAYPDYLPTYLGSTSIYDHADNFILEGDTTVADIYLVHKPESNNGSYYFGGFFIGCSCVGDGCPCTGYIHNPYRGSSKKSALTDTTRVTGVYVYLLDEQGEIMAWAVTDSLGYFSMDSIPEGTFIVYFDFMGLPVISGNDTIVFDENHQEYNIDAVADENGISVTFVDVTAVDERETDAGISVFPNPVSDNLYLKFDKALERDVRIRIIGIDGSILKTLQPGPLQGKAVLDISLSDLPPGLYILSVEGNKISYKARIVKQ